MNIPEIMSHAMGAYSYLYAEMTNKSKAKMSKVPNFANRGQQLWQNLDIENLTR